MLNGKKVVVVLPAYKAGKTLERTYALLDKELIDEVLLVDDAGGDNTAEIARQMGITTFQHSSNLGYGANQKTCYREALRRGADVVVMVHPDYQYEPRLAVALASLVATGVYDAAIGSRMLTGTALKGGMPLYKFIANKLLTAFQNTMIGASLSEYHTGYRAFSRDVLETLPLLGNSDDFVFDNQMLTQVVAFNYQIGEISCPTKYFEEASSINLRRSITYGFGVLRTSIKYRLWKLGLINTSSYRNSPTLRLVEYYT
ncbi:glycosyltransferase family 2 protein [Rubinisphaera brasiliensis]|uniref:Glycosyl transferase family 2 n=1 Tax=Rubinisphaera brasiliensis (strain ATCC 49424 / DSM 5305 / JCM 21570 / IAM 15109 / NBRC 103401 / IFAM 1448) TaxID=756272 RepID=F0SL85_RUBBR|nr:glycosyltransferase family 2 protein [Rubinisphaera brasiliensis]ADY60968.1 glycosyl transferase family 2 [Rubinisphaera brasiliensis DSM 5305]